MIKRVILFLIIISMVLGSVAFVSAMDEDMIQVAQWARSAEASSQYGDDDWSADQATLWLCHIT